MTSLLSQAPPLATSTPVQRVEPTVVAFTKPCSPAPSSQPAPPTRPPPLPRVIPSSRNEPLGLNVADFLPVSFPFPLSRQNFLSVLLTVSGRSPQSTTGAAPSPTTALWHRSTKVTTPCV